MVNEGTFWAIRGVFLWEHEVKSFLRVLELVFVNFQRLVKCSYFLDKWRMCNLGPGTVLNYHVVFICEVVFIFEVVFILRSSSFWDCLHFEVVFILKSSSFRGRLHFEVVFILRSSSFWGCLNFEVIFHVKFHLPI